MPDPTAVHAFLQLSAHVVALQLAGHQSEMLAAGLSEATVNCRPAAVRSLLKFSYRLGLAKTGGRGLVDSEKFKSYQKVKSYRDTRGTDLKALRRLLVLPAALHGAGTLRTLRDAALLRVLAENALRRLLAENALRRAEVTALNVGDFSLTEKRLMILGKGRAARKRRSLSRPNARRLSLPTSCLPATRETTPIRCFGAWTAGTHWPSRSAAADSGRPA